MLLTAAVVLIVVVIGGAVSLIMLDMEGRPAGSWFHAVKEWQQTVGALLGFLGAAGVLVLSNELAANQRAAEAARAQNAIGYGLALEAESLAGGVSSMLGIVKMIEAQPSIPDPNRVCVEFIATLKRVLPAETTVYNAVLAHLVDFGDQNLSIFVRFYAAYGMLVQEANTFDSRNCQINAINEIAYVRTSMRSMLVFYDVIAKDYGTIPQEVPPENVTMPPAGTAPASSAPAPTAPTATVTTTAAQ